MTSVPPAGWLRARAERTPERPALVLPDRRLDWSELARETEALAAALVGRGVRPGDVVATWLPSADFALALHACWRAGALVQPLNARLTRPEIAFQLRDAGSHWLLHGCDAERALDAAGDARGPARLSWAAIADAAGPHGSAPVALPSPVPDRGTDPPLAILYTSGTTGRPKGAVLTARAFAASARASAERLGSAPTDRALACLPLFHVGGLSVLVRSLFRGSCVQVQERFDPEAVAHALEHDGITDVSLVANMLARVLDVRREAPAPARLRAVLVGGGPLPEPLERRAHRLGWPIAPTYGLTEAASQVATRAPSDADSRGLPPLPGVEVRIAPERGGDACTGEILVRGPNLMAGYWRRPEETARALRDGWLHTGDLGRLHPDGSLEVLDRRSDLIVSGGENVYPAEVESVLLAHPAVAEAGVRGLPDARFGARPAAWFVPAPGRTASASELRDFCRERLAGFKVPVKLHPAARLPRTAAGKLVRARLGERQDRG